MKILYDSYADALYIHMNGSKKKAKETVEVRSDLLVDFSNKGELLGIEVLDISNKMPKKSLRNVHFELTAEKPKSLLA